MNCTIDVADSKVGALQRVRERNDLTINVGLGQGSKAEQLAHLQMIIGAQKDAIAAGMVSPKNLYESAKQLVRLAGYKDSDSYFTAPGKAPDSNDPASAAIQSPVDPKGPGDPAQGAA